MGTKDIINDSLEIRRYLDHMYKFHDSKSHIYIFDPTNPVSIPQELYEIEGFHDIKLKLKSYRGCCIYTNGQLGFDYVILISTANNMFSFGLGRTIAEETMHGEHGKIHIPSEYIFSEIAVEFFGGIGNCEIIKRNFEVPGFPSVSGNFICDMMQSESRYDEMPDAFTFELNHQIGYELAKEAVFGDSNWKTEMFHETDERNLWYIYNSRVIPIIQIRVPKNLKNRENFRDYLNNSLKTLGLKFNLHLYNDER